jgi:cytidine deaminase
MAIERSELEHRARAACEQAYAPYSRFKVGAAVETGDGRYFTGCNIENASYGLTLCAERVAVFSAIAAGARSIVAVAIYTPTTEPAPPCGACRQVLQEFGDEVTITSITASGMRKSWKLDALLPEPFGLDPAATDDP